MKAKKIIIIILLVLLVGILGFLVFNVVTTNNVKTVKVDLSKLTYTVKKESNEIKKYTQDDYSAFLSDYNNGNLPEIYITEFVFDGAGMYKTYDLDDFIESGNDVEVKALETTAFNINTTGNIELSGEIKGATILVNTNNISDDINILLNNVNIDTDSKKIPAIYVYNKDINYTTHKVTISAKENTKNYIEGGKFKKVSLIDKDNLDSYSNNYSSNSATWYKTYTNYYGVYTKEEIEKVLFASVQADKEDLSDGDPLYFYKGAGAISSDIDLYFEGKGYLEVTSKNKEGIETKGNLTFSGGIGDYVINAQDDCLNTTTSSSNNNSARNELTIDVNSLKAIVSLEADEEDAIDSNGSLIINGGTIIALAKPGQDAGIDSETGTYINGGEVFATGDMYDEIKSDSKQMFMGLSFSMSIKENDLITLVDSSDNVVFAFSTDRTYKNIVYSSPNLKEETYYLYKDGQINGTSENGLYTKIDSYTKGSLLAYSQTGMQSNMGGGMMPNDSNGNMTPPDMQDGSVPEKPDGENKMQNNDDNRPQMQNGNMTPPDMQDGNAPEKPDGDNIMQNETNQSASNKEFALSGISNLFSGISTYSE